MISGRRVKRSPEGAVPHDLGDPWDEPFAAVNAYVYQARNALRMHTSKLGLKFTRLILSRTSLNGKISTSSSSSPSSGIFCLPEEKA